MVEWLEWSKLGCIDYSFVYIPRFSAPKLGSKNLLIPPRTSPVAAGVDALLIEVHPNPERALKDGPQSLKPDNFAQLMLELKAVAQAVGRSI